MRLIGKLAVAGASVFVLLQAVRPGIPVKSAAAEISLSADVRDIIQKDCYSCHSDQRRLAWFDEIVPAYWLVRYDILTARKHLNFSTLGSKPLPLQKASLFEAANMIQLGAMPPAKFLALHPEAKVTQADLTSLKTYLAPWSSVPGSASAGTAAVQPATKLSAVPPEFNGLAFDPGYRTWKPISFTDRGDNNTFRFILGNEVAIQAAEAGDISPWPDGARFAKIAWQQESGSDGLIHPGKFAQVEFMVKDAKLHQRTQGWNWGRWRGMDLKPYGDDAGFVNECTGCHAPMRADDHVYTLPISRADASRSLPIALPYQPLKWDAITMYVDPGAHAMATLYGNQAAAHVLQGSGVKSDGSPAYPPGAVLALVTWTQREDPHWFGGRIPDMPRSVEFVESDSQGKPNRYRCYQGPAWEEKRVSTESAAQRSKVIWSLAPAVSP